MTLYTLGRASAYFRVVQTLALVSQLCMYGSPKLPVPCKGLQTSAAA